MAGTAITALVSLAAGAVSQSLFGGKTPDAPAPTAAPVKDDAADKKRAQQSADQQRMKAGAAAKENSTILTDPSLGEVKAENKSATNLLGY